jgi:hypothetical protein
MNIAKLLASWKTVFSIEDLWFLLDMQHDQSLRNYVSRLWKQGILQSLWYGLWAFSRYEKYELVNKLKKNSYISLETVLYTHWIIYQDYGQTLFACSDDTQTKVVNAYTCSFHTLKAKLLLDPRGIDHKGHYSIACPERAVCDRLYLTPWYYFDDLTMISRSKIDHIAEIYPKSTRLSLEKLHYASQRNS